MNWQNEIERIYNKMLDMYPYKQSGNRDSYSDFNQGWAYCCDVYSQEMEGLLEKLQVYIDHSKYVRDGWGTAKNYDEWRAKLDELVSQIERLENEPDR